MDHHPTKSHAYISPTCILILQYLHPQVNKRSRAIPFPTLPTFQKQAPTAIPCNQSPSLHSNYYLTIHQTRSILLLPYAPYSYLSQRPSPSLSPLPYAPLCTLRFLPPVLQYILPISYPHAGFFTVYEGEEGNMTRSSTSTFLLCLHPQLFKSPFISDLLASLKRLTQKESLKPVKRNQKEYRTLPIYKTLVFF